MLGVVLAGGLSSRMGVDKAELEVAGLNQLQRSLQLLKEVGCQETLVSRNQPGFIQDHYPKAGPLAGIHGVLSHYRGEAPLAVIIPVDMPLLQSSQLSPLIEFTQQQAQACYYERCYLPLVLPLNEALQSHLEQQLECGEYRVRCFLAQLNAKALPFQQGFSSCNTNTPAEWQEARAILSRKTAAKHIG